MIKLPEKLNTSCDKLLNEVTQEAKKLFEIHATESTYQKRKFKFYQILMNCSLETYINEKSSINLVKRIIEILFIINYIVIKYKDKQMKSVIDKAAIDNQKAYGKLRTYRHLLYPKENRWPSWIELVKPIQRKWQYLLRMDYENKRYYPLLKY